MKSGDFRNVKIVYLLSYRLLEDKINSKWLTNHPNQ